MEDPTVSLPAPDPALARALKDDLLPGESVEWAAHPDPRHFARLRAHLVTLGVFWTVVAGVGFYGFGVTLLDAEYDGLSVGVRVLILLLSGAPFLVVSIVALGGHVPLFARIARRTVYGLTNQRLLLRGPLWIYAGPIRTRGLSRTEIATVQCTPHRDNASTLEVHGSSSAEDPVRLRSVPDGAQVAGLLRS